MPTVDDLRRQIQAKREKARRLLDSPSAVFVVATPAETVSGTLFDDPARPASERDVALVLTAALAHLHVDVIGVCRALGDERGPRVLETVVRSANLLVERHAGEGVGLGVVVDSPQKGD